MDRKDRIFAYMSSKEYTPLTFEELSISLDVPKEDIPELFLVLEELISDGKIFLSKKKRYALSAQNNLFSGILSVNPRTGTGFVTCEEFDEDILVSPKNISTALDGDKVLVRVIGTYKGRKDGVVEKILERRNTTLSAVITDDFYAVFDTPKITKRLKLTDLGDAKNGDRVLVEICDYAKNGDIFGRVISVLGNSRDIKSLTESIIFEHGIAPGFSEEAIVEAKSFPEEIKMSSFPKRLDLRDKIIFTIDGDDARDFDDAVSLEILENGNYELGVHIADVSHYVRENSALDRDAYSRGTSVYLADRVIPMLPFELSNNLCSLMPKVERLALSVTMEIDHSGKILSHRIDESVIKSCERMTYNNVAKILDGDSVLSEKYAHIVPTLKNMHRLSKILFEKRKNRGSIDFDFPESKVLVDENSMPVDVVKVERNDAHKLIEEFMLVTNETVAEAAFWQELPFVYRVHEEPDTEKMDSFRRFIGGFGLYMKGKEVYPKDLQQILDEIKGTDNEILIATYMLRSLMKASYDPECLGHFGLAAKYYCHFTSPIRRYPDLMIHRILKAMLKGEDTEKYRGTVALASVQSSETEKTAELCERDVEDLYKAAYIMDFVGAEFTAKVSGVTKFGIFAELENSVEGMIRLETIPGDFYEFDENMRAVVGQRHGKTYKIGDTVEIEVVGADLLSRNIDFVLKGSTPIKKVEKTKPYKKHTFYKKAKKNKRG